MSTDSDPMRRTEAAESLYRHAREALRDGENERAKQLLLRAVDYDRNHSDAWLWLSATTDDLLEQKHYLEWAIAADPSNAAAKRGLGLVTGKIKTEDLAPDDFAQTIPPTPAEPAPAAVERTFTCPRCGGALRYPAGTGELRCGHCGYMEALPAVAGADQDQVLDFALPTKQGQRWAVGERAFKCQQCGATTVATVGSKSEQCPFCGAAALLAAAEDKELLRPQSLIPMMFDADQAQTALAGWLKKGFFVPDDLTLVARERRMRPVYAPFWVFSASVTAHWRATVTEEEGGRQRQVVRTGERTFFFTRQPQPATRSLPAELARQASPFNWERLVAYDAGYLAGWPAGTYDVSLADASLEARQGMLASARRELQTKAVPGQIVPDVQVTSSDFSGQSYQLALLPLWIGAYEYRKQAYRVLVNGQSGTVAGDRPVDRVKVALIALLVVAAVAPLLILLILWLTGGFAR